ncbi:MAG: hypothetical protein WC916_00670 [Candidatus Woesearchaeota archaeon]
MAKDIKDELSDKLSGALKFGKKAFAIGKEKLVEKTEELKKKYDSSVSIQTTVGAVKGAADSFKKTVKTKIDYKISDLQTKADGGDEFAKSILDVKNAVSEQYTTIKSYCATLFKTGEKNPVNEFMPGYATLMQIIDAETATEGKKQYQRDFNATTRISVDKGERKVLVKSHPFISIESRKPEEKLETKCTIAFNYDVGSGVQYNKIIADIAKNAVDFVQKEIIPAQTGSYNGKSAMIANAGDSAIEYVIEAAFNNNALKLSYIPNNKFSPEVVITQTILSDEKK